MITLEQKFAEMIKIADIHANRITEAMSELIGIFPLSPKEVESLSERNLLLIELLINRFSKLQDYLGRKVIDGFLEVAKEFSEDMTMLDKLNKLEKLRIIDNVESFEDMRKARNYLVHEYPGETIKRAEFLNQLFMLSPKLLAVLENIKKRL